MGQVVGGRVAARQARARVRRKSSRVLVVSTALAALILGTMGYLIYATAHNNRLLARSVELYQDQFNAVSPAERSHLLDAAHAYNDDLSRRPVTPPPIGQGHTHERWGEYIEQLDGPGGVMATITIPDHDIALPVYHGTADETLRKGAGHLYGTHLPVGADAGRVGTSAADLTGVTTAISAHTGMHNKSMFDNLQYMTDGDMAFIRVAGETLGYRMVSRAVVSPDETEAIVWEPGKDLLQLITCTPYGINFNRLVVTLERVPDEEVRALAPEDLEVSTGVTDNVSGLTLGMLAASGVTVVGYAAVVAWEYRIRRRSYTLINEHYSGLSQHRSKRTSRR